eukprot:4723147-Prymnesium_polylepis.1
MRQMAEANNQFRQNTEQDDPQDVQMQNHSTGMGDAAVQHGKKPPRKKKKEVNAVQLNVDMQQVGTQEKFSQMANTELDSALYDQKQTGQLEKETVHALDKNVKEAIEKEGRWTYFNLMQAEPLQWILQTALDECRGVLLKTMERGAHEPIQWLIAVDNSGSMSRIRNDLAE